jgi:prepilin-type N-terminal cleavage/methylation domain-containing protein
MKLWRNCNRSKQDGFTLLEMMISIVILSLVIGAVFSQLNLAQERMSAEQTKLDDFQQARDFVDQFFRDINQIGDPNIRMFDQAAMAPAFVAPLMNDSRLATGLVRIDNTSIWFEGSVNGIGTVQSIQYQINGSAACALCLQRSQVDKVNGSPLAQATNWGTEVNDVLSNPIFRYYDVNGVQIPPASLPIDLNTAGGPAILATVKTIVISLRIQNPQKIDAQNGQPIESVFEGEVSLNNCTIAINGQPMSCQ